MSTTKQQQQTIMVAAGTYDGVLAAYQLQTSNDNDNKLELVCAVPIHSGSVRDLCVDSNNNKLVSSGYDETLHIHDFDKHHTNVGEIRTPADFGTPVTCAFAPPSNNHNDTHHHLPTHMLVGFGNSLNPTQHRGGKLIIYKKRDWTIQHVLAGHEGGISCLAVHPSGKLAISGGLSDGKLKVWDLVKGRLAYSCSEIKTALNCVDGRKRYESISSIVWRQDHTDCYAFCYANHVTVRDVNSGKELLDVELPSRVNQICLLDNAHGLFVAAACNDGSLPVLAVKDKNTNSDNEERRAIMAVEPVDNIVGNSRERFKCIQAIYDNVVAVANSAGVVSVYDLSGAIRMILQDEDDDKNVDDNDTNTSDGDQSDEEEELAVEIIDSVQLGTGARITCLAAWLSPESLSSSSPPAELLSPEESVPESPPVKEASPPHKKQRHTKHVVMDADAIEKARALVSKAKKIQKKKKKHDNKLAKNNR